MNYIKKKKKSGFYFHKVKNLKIEDVCVQDIMDEEIMKYNVE